MLSGPLNTRSEELNTGSNALIPDSVAPETEISQSFRRVSNSCLFAQIELIAVLLTILQHLCVSISCRHKSSAAAARLRTTSKLVLFLMDMHRSTAWYFAFNSFSKDAMISLNSFSSVAAVYPESIMFKLMYSII